MEPPPIQYVRTPDGFDIAYTVTGEGIPFVFMPWPFSHRGLWWQSVFGRPISEALAQRFRLVQYDSRGQGLSTRGLPEDFSLDDYLTDLEAVVDRLGLQRFVLLGSPLFGHVAVKYAVRRPERVIALVLHNVAVRRAWGGDALDDLARRDWDAFIYTFAATSSGPGVPIETEYWRQSLTRNDFLMMSRAGRESSIGELSPLVRVPTLVCVNRYQRDGQTTAPWFEDAKFMAASMPRGHLDISDTLDDITVPGPAGVPPFVLRVEEFLNNLGADANSSQGPERSDSGLRLSSGGDLSTLSRRQREVLHLIAEGKTNREIAEALVLSDRTVQRHIADIYAKIGARNRVEATAIALGRPLLAN